MSLEQVRGMVERALDGADCAMIEPLPNYARDDQEMANKRTEWKDENKAVLPKLISESMQEKYKNSVLEALSLEIPIVYVDCAAKGRQHILFFIMQKFLERYTGGHQDSIVQETILRHTMLSDEGRETLKSYSTSYTGKEFTKDFLSLYVDILRQSIDDLESQKAGSGDLLQKFEGSVPEECIVGLLKDQNVSRAYLYLDNVFALSRPEQQAINNILFARGGIDTHIYLYIKVNNGGKGWNTYSTESGHMVQGTHDYMCHSIRESDLL